MSVVNVILAILLLSFIVLVHELGHYTAGRLLGFGIQEFAVGFGPKLLRWRRKGIDYSIRALPLGGYVRYLGEDDDDDNPKAFNNLPAWKRFLAILAGPAMNFALAFVVAFLCIAAIGLPVGAPVPQVAQVAAGMPAELAGLQVGDRIVAVNGEAISFDEAGYQRMTELFAGHDAATPVTLTIERGGQSLDLSVALTEVDGAKRIGISIASITQH
ncbi:MAG: PDZ domain-containing protein, partial [Clostridiales bacterium]|nr:PDZ domain-containing protein [Clostridiales bacterium]